MDTEEKNPHAVALGKRGGAKIAERGPEYFAELQAQRKERKGGRPRLPSVADNEGILKIGDAELECAVLPGGVRVLSRTGFLRALGRTGKAKGGRKYDQEFKVPVFLSAANLKPFIPDELLENSGPIPFRLKNGTTAIGYKAELLAHVCNVFLDAKDAGALHETQVRIADQCKVLSRGFAVVGITALIDEATGYQAIRDRQALQAILDKYLRKEFAAWAKRFPDEFYREMFRLKGWQWKGVKVNKPQVVGHYTKDLVYDRLAPNILEELERRNPKNPRGHRRVKHHQWLTEDIGIPGLAQHLHALLGLMRASDTWKQFHDMVKRAFPKKDENRDIVKCCGRGGSGGALFDQFSILEFLSF